MQIQLAVLPVRHRAARFHRVMPRGLDDECFVEDEVGVLESRLEIAERPFLERASHRQTVATASELDWFMHGIRTIFRRLARKRDPWAQIDRDARSLDEPRRHLEALRAGRA